MSKPVGMKEAVSYLEQRRAKQTKSQGEEVDAAAAKKLAILQGKDTPEPEPEPEPEDTPEPEPVKGVKPSTEKKQGGK